MDLHTAGMMFCSGKGCIGYCISSTWESWWLYIVAVGGSNMKAWVYQAKNLHMSNRSAGQAGTKGYMWGWLRNCHHGLSIDSGRPCLCDWYMCCCCTVQGVWNNFGCRWGQMAALLGWGLMINDWRKGKHVPWGTGRTMENCRCCSNFWMALVHEEGNNHKASLGSELCSTMYFPKKEHERTELWASWGVLIGPFCAEWMIADRIVMSKTKGLHLLQSHNCRRVSTLNPQQQ